MSLIFIGVKAAVLCHRDDGLLAFWTVDGRPNGEPPNTCLTVTDNAVTVFYDVSLK